MTYPRDEMRSAVIERAKNCCEYCLMPQIATLVTFEIDHIIPIKHRGSTIESNLCLSCFDCNRAKGSDFASFDPVDDQVVLFYHPRKHQWNEHFVLDGAQIRPISPQGRVTEFIFKFNATTRIFERRILIRAKRYPPAQLPIWKRD